ncbi:hypothetical protein [Parabacteroides sp. Marseille-P3160]|uniref:hypothetical protein n=1 Tax=Parabacteroides sp. Marseille-P3160 TaxID=1917887 RepID=UPI0009BA3FEA|nr:hypothetical protein [Parabacteroides sp. Marseille-P3160]
MKVINYMVVVILWMAASGISAQNVMTSSPYSMFGIGEMASGLYGANISMGGVSYGIRKSEWLNTANPAGLTAIDSSSLLGEISSFLKNESYRSSGNSNNVLTGNFSAIVLGGRLKKHWYASVGLLPYSSVGYYFQTKTPLEGTVDSYYDNIFEGSGGLSKLYLSNAFSLPLNFSFGVNLNYVFGKLKQTETQSTMSVAQEMDAKAFSADFGLQYERAIDRKTTLSMGIVYGYKQELAIKNTSTITTSSSTTIGKAKAGDQYLPQYIGLGIALNRKKWTQALDYSFYQYSVLNSGDSRVKFNDSHELRYGLSFLPSEHSFDSYWKRVGYKAGVNVSTPYYKISGNSGIAYRLSLGLDLPVMNGCLHTAFFYDHLNVTGRLRRNTLGFALTYSFGERFYKLKL